MPNKNYIRGVKFERELQEAFEKEFPGSQASRTAGSHGVFDVIGFCPITKTIHFIQAKTKVCSSPQGISIQDETGFKQGEFYRCYFLRYTKQVKKVKRKKKK